MKAQVDRASVHYTNLLTEVKAANNVRWVTRTRNFPVFKNNKERTPTEIIETVLKSERVEEIVGDESERRKWPRRAVMAEARQIVTEMGHSFQLSTVRGVGLVLSFVIQKVFSGIYVNVDKLEWIRSIFSEYPVIFMPSHNTYMDFLLFSFICFAYELPLPAIAAGMDFQSMKLVGEALRRCGAFFIRRSFGQDRLYWAVFTEYVQCHLRNGDRPVEFFIEGTRSRTGKSLFPKYGLISTLLEPYFRSQVYDLVIIPVSMNYEKILEEKLYGYELLGFQKPKESTSGLLKAASILKSDFGDVFVTFGDPISVREYFGSDISRSEHALEPDARFTLTPTERTAIKILGHKIIKTQQSNSVVTLWSLACIVLRSMDSENSGAPIPYELLCTKLEYLLDLTDRLGFVIPLHRGSLHDDLCYYVQQLHSNLVEVNNWDSEPDKRTLRIRHPEQSISTIKKKHKNAIEAQLVDQSVNRIIIGNYANRAMHLYADVAFVALAIGDALRISIEAVWTKFRFLQDLMQRDFIFIPTKQKGSFREALQRLKQARAIIVTNGIITVVTPRTLVNPRRLTFLSEVIQPYLAAYWIVCDVLRVGGVTVLTENVIARNAQARIGQLLAERHPAICYQMLSMDLLRNAFNSLISNNILVNSNGDSSAVRLNFEKLVHFQLRLRSFLFREPPSMAVKAKL